MEFNSLLSNYSLKIVKTLSKESGLQALVDIGYEMLGNPFTITDFSTKLLSVTGKTKVTDDPVWNELELNKNFIFQTYSYYVRNNLFDQVAKSESPFYWSDPYCKYPRIIGKINIGDKNVALIVVCAHERNFEINDLEIVSFLCEVFSIELQKNKYINYSKELSQQSFLHDLLEGKLVDEKMIDERMKILSLKFKKTMFVISLDIYNLDTTESTLAFMRNEIEKKLVNSLAVIYNHTVVILAYCENETLFLEVESKWLKTLIKAHNLYAGISRSFSNIAEVREHYQESVKAIKLGNLVNKENNFFKYENYLIYDFIDSYSHDGKHKKIINRSLIKLIEHDKENGTEYARSFYAYLCSFKNIKDSASILNIHRNTMFYRIEKIESILNVDMNDGDVLFHLYLSYKILEFLKIELP